MGPWICEHQVRVFSPFSSAAENPSVAACAGPGCILPAANSTNWFAYAAPGDPLFFGGRVDSPVGVPSQRPR